MSIKRNILSDADIQSFSVSSSSVFVPFVWDLPSTIFTKIRKNSDELKIDAANNMLLCLPKDMFDVLYSKGLVDYKPDTQSISLDPNSQESIASIEAALYRESILAEHLATVRVKNMSFSNFQSAYEQLKQMKYFVIVDSVRVTPYIGELIPSSSYENIRRNSVPKEHGKSINGDSLVPSIDPRSTSSNEIDNLRQKFFEDINKAANSDQVIDQNIHGPFVMDINKSTSFHCNNQIILDQDKQELYVHTNIEKPPKITYNGAGDIYTSKANTRIYGTPVAYYDTNEADNPGQSYQHSTFFTPTPGLISSPLGGLTSKNQELPALFKEFGGLI